MGDEAKDTKNHNLRKFMLFYIVVLLALAMIFPLLINPSSWSSKPPVQPQKTLAKEMQEIGIPTDKFNELLEKIKRDINRENVEIKVLIGPYYQRFRINGLLLPPDFFSLNRTYLILFDDNLYNKLSRKEREALIAHEVGHFLNPSVAFDPKDIIKIQVSADTFAAKYVDPKDLLGLLDKVFVEYITRRENIEQVIKSR